MVGKILADPSSTFGFNAQTEEYVDMLRPASSIRPRSSALRSRGRLRSPASS